jgi:hypothetical protein
MNLSSFFVQHIRCWILLLSLFGGGICQAQIPSNDSFSRRISLSGFKASAFGSNINASKEKGEISYWNGARSVWWTWQAPTSGQVMIDLSGSSFDTTLSVYTGTAVNALTTIARNDDYYGLQSRVTFTAVSGRAYQIGIDGYSASSGSIRLALTQTPSAIAPTIVSQPVNQTIYAGQNVAFSVTASGTGPLSYQWLKNGSSIGTGPSLTLTNAQSSAAGSYTCRVSNSAGSVTSQPAALTVLLPAIAPKITSQPVNQTVIAGQNTKFSVLTSGTAPLSYQWYKDGSTPVLGATSATLSLIGVRLEDAGAYTCRVSNVAGVANSQAGVLSVTVLRPSITSPLTTAAFTGFNFSYQITATENPRSYSAVGLPPGLSVNAATGTITGGLSLSGTFPITISATNSAGTANATLVLTVARSGGRVALFSNGSYVDASGELLQARASLEALGFTITPFSGISAADWTGAFSTSDAVVIPELERAKLVLTADAIAAINLQLNAGKGLITMGTHLDHTAAFLNSVRGWSLAYSGYLSGSSVSKVAGIPEFPSSPATMAAPNATFFMSAASLPTGAKTIYQGTPGVAVFLAGRVAYLGYDWYAGRNAGWDLALTDAFSAITTSPPISIPDPKLLQAIRTALNKPTGNITPADMLTLRNLDIAGLGVTNLSGLEYASNIRILNIRRNNFTSAAAVWAVLDRISPIYCLYTDVRRPGSDPAGYSTQVVTDTAGNQFFITVDTPNLPTLDISGLGIDSSNPSNIGALLSFADAGVAVETGGVNLPPAARATATVINATTRQVLLDGRASSDVDGSIVSYAWSWPSGSASGSNPTLTLPRGNTTLNLLVTDNSGASSSTSVSVLVELPVTIPDAALLAAVRTALGRPTGIITDLNLLTLRNLNLAGLGIRSLSGLQYATNLRILNLRNNPFTSAVALWTVLDQITPMYCLYTDVRRPGNDPAGYTTQTVTDTQGNPFFITVDAPNLPTLDISGLGIDTSNPANIGALLTFSDAGVAVETGGANLPPAARASSTLGNTATREVRLDGRTSADIDGSVVSHAWSWSGGTATGANPTVFLPYGDIVVSLIVTDNRGSSANTTTTVNVIPRDDVDTDADGLNDLAEYELRTFGFDWNSPQASLVANLTLAGLLERSELSAAGFLPIASVPTVHLPAPALARNPSNGRLRMTMNLQRPSVSGGLSDIPSVSGNIRVNSAGEIELEFLESAPFIRVDAR